jgi:small-conductance mechanosensitive channel
MVVFSENELNLEERFIKPGGFAFERRVNLMEKLIKQWLADPWVIKFLIAFLGLVVIRLLLGVLRRSIPERVIDSQARYRVRKLITLSGYLLVLLFLAIVFKDKLGGLTVVLGFTGAGVAIALQEVIVSLAGGVAIATGNFYATGDRVKIGGITGDVIDIGVLRTTLMECGEWVKADLPTGRLVRVANSLVFREPIFNYSVDFPFLWDEVVFPVKYGTDHRLAREIFTRVLTEVVGNYAEYAKRVWTQIVKKYYIEEAMIDPVVTLRFTDNWIELTGRFITDYRTRRNTMDKIFSRLLEEIDKTQGQVGVASSTFELVNPPPLEVRLSGQQAAEG